MKNSSSRGVFDALPKLHKPSPDVLTAGVINVETSGSIEDVLGGGILLRT